MEGTAKEIYYPDDTSSESIRMDQSIENYLIKSSARKQAENKYLEYKESNASTKQITSEHIKPSAPPIFYFDSGHTNKTMLSFTRCKNGKDM